MGWSRKCEMETDRALIMKKRAGIRNVFHESSSGSLRL